LALIQPRTRSLEQRLPGLAVLAAEGRPIAPRQRLQRRQLGAHVRGEVQVRNPVREREPGIRHRRRDGRVIGQERRLERVEVAVDVGRDGRLDRRQDVDQDHVVPVVAEPPQVLASAAQRIGPALRDRRQRHRFLQLRRNGPDDLRRHDALLAHHFVERARVDVPAHDAHGGERRELEPVGERRGAPRAEGPWALGQKTDGFGVTPKPPQPRG
jgi:hypothetical protein